MMVEEKPFEYQPMVYPYRLFAWQAKLEVYQTSELVLILHSSSVVLFSSGS
jgi:hypothetical protein